MAPADYGSVPAAARWAFSGSRVFIPTALQQLTGGDFRGPTENRIRTRACTGTQRSGRSRGYPYVETHDDSKVWELAVGATSVALPARYRPRSPKATVLHRAVRTNLGPFLADARERSEHGFGLPRFVDEEFRSFIDCGVISRGLMRVRCGGCGD